MAFQKPAGRSHLIAIRVPNRDSDDTYSRKFGSNSWTCDRYEKMVSFRDNCEMVDDVFTLKMKPISDYKPYNAVENCKSAGVIPYTHYQGKLLFLLQHATNPSRKKDQGWNDFGGKKIQAIETTAQTAAREFSEETSGLFYLQHRLLQGEDCETTYHNLKDNFDLTYNANIVTELLDVINSSKQHFAKKICELDVPIYISSKETYISYFLKVDYVPADDIPRAEDIHIPYETRYLRSCRWFTYQELLELNEKDFHKRLQITRIQQRLIAYHAKGVFY